VTPRKGHDVLIEALATLTDLPWTCVCVGATDRAPDHVERLRRLTRSYGLGERVRFVGPRTGADLASAYAAADLLVLPSRAETYGMVVTEALARGLPVVASAVGGVPEALSGVPGSLRRTARGDLPGALVPAGDPVALAGALGGWLREPRTRRWMRDAALDRRAGLPGWDATARSVADVVGALRTPVREV
jgi:glycosyltransferase involved in cell wall biosynthesis